MPVIQTGQFDVDYSDSGGSGPAVLLVPSTASGNRQWRKLTESAGDRYRLLAINMFGYGSTSAWPGERRQTMEDQAQLALAVAALVDGPLTVVGHSFGGSVAIQTALQLGDRLSGLALFEPNPFHLLGPAGDAAGFAEGRRIRDLVKQHGARNDWLQVAEGFAEYWVGDGAWAAMPANRQQAFADSLRPNFYEWDALYVDGDPGAPRVFDLPQLRQLAAPVMVMTSAGARPAIRAIDNLFRASFGHWRFEAVAEGGHMAPLSRPDLVNPLLLDFFDRLHS